MAEYSVGAQPTWTRSVSAVFIPHGFHTHTDRDHFLPMQSLSSHQASTPCQALWCTLGCTVVRDSWSLEKLAHRKALLGFLHSQQLTLELLIPEVHLAL